MVGIVIAGGSFEQKKGKSRKTMKLVKLNNGLRRNNTLLPNEWDNFDSLDLLGSALGGLWGPETSINGIKTQENSNNYILEFSIPGFKKEDVSLFIDSGKVTVTAKSDRNGVKNQFYREIYIDNFETLDLDKGVAKLEDGVLVVTFPKTEKARGRQIKIE